MGKELNVGDKIYFLIKSTLSKKFKYDVVYSEIVEKQFNITSDFLYYTINYDDIKIYVKFDDCMVSEKNIYKIIRVFVEDKTATNNKYYQNKCDVILGTMGSSYLFDNEDDVLDEYRKLICDDIERLEQQLNDRNEEYYDIDNTQKIISIDNYIEKTSEIHSCCGGGV